MKNKSKAPKKKSPNFERIQIKAQPDVYSKLQKRANKYADGNLSAWLRRAGLKYVPAKI